MVLLWTMEDDRQCAAEVVRRGPWFVDVTWSLRQWRGKSGERASTAVLELAAPTRGGGSVGTGGGLVVVAPKT
jgi:hypothetical protein